MGGYSYPEVGATAGELPGGYHHLHASTVLGEGRDLFERAGEVVMTWGVQRGAGLQVDAAADRAAPGVDVTTTLRLGPVGLPAPCRVVYVVDEPDRRGYAYGTLAGHPETGEESFVVSIDGEGVVTFTVTAFSRGATWWSRLGGPVTRWVQQRVTLRYLEALPTS